MSIFTVKLLITVFLPLIIGLIVCLFWRSKMKTAKIARLADDNIPTGGFNLTVKSDVFSHRTTTRVKVQDNKR